jgi:hypothetical protein
VLVIVTNYVPDLIADFYPPEVEMAAVRAWQLVARGFQAFILFLMVWALLPWKPKEARLAGSLAAGWGAVESIQIPMCRLAYDMTQRPQADTQLYKGMCDHVTGWPIYMGTLLLVLLIFAFQYTKRLAWTFRQTWSAPSQASAAPCSPPRCS